MPAAAMPAATRLFLAGNAVAMTGNGLVLAFTLIYLHQARGIALPVVGLLLAAGAAAGLLAVTVSGILLDRLGARRVLTGIILGQATAQVLLAWAHNAATALPALLLYGATWAPMFPAIATVIAGLTPDPAAQQRVFAINFTAQNAAIGIGTVLGAAVANVHHPGSFQALFLANAVSCLIFAMALTFLPALRTAPARKEPRAGYRDVLARPGLRLVLVASLIVAFTAYPAFDSGLPAYASVEAHAGGRHRRHQPGRSRRPRHPGAAGQGLQPVHRRLGLPAGPAGGARRLRHPGHHRCGVRPPQRGGDRLRAAPGPLAARWDDRPAGPGFFLQRVPGEGRRHRRRAAGPADSKPQAPGPAPPAGRLVLVPAWDTAGAHHRVRDHHRHRGRTAHRRLPPGHYPARPPPPSRIRAGQALPRKMGCDVKSHVVSCHVVWRFRC